MCNLKYKNGLPLVNYHLKNILFVFNFLSWLVGLALLCIGTYATVYKAFQATAASDMSLDPVTPIFFIGSLIFVITFFGCVGSLRENLCMLRFFSYALALVLLVEICLAFMVLTASGNIRQHIQKLMHKSIVHYRDDPDLQNIIDWGQEEFQCCGVTNMTDWSNNMYFNCSANNPSMEKCGVPYSCCRPPGDDDIINTLCGMDVQVMDPFDVIVVIYMDGCLLAFTTWLHSNMFYLFLVFIVLGCIPQIFGILISRILVIQIKDQDFYTKLGLLNPRGELEWF